MKTSKQILIDNFKKHGLRIPEIHEGWFSDSLLQGLPEQICFAHLDGDLYDSILTSLQFGSNLLPGVKAACDEYLRDKPEKVSLIYAGNHSHGFFRKL